MLNDYHIGDSLQYVCVEYAKSARSGCRKCKEKIGQQELRVGILVDDDHFSTGQGTQWFHKDCFHFKPRHGALQVNEIAKKLYGLEGLSKKDQKDVIAYMKNQLAAIKEPKNKRATGSKSKSKPKQVEEKKEEQKNKSKPKKAESKKVQPKISVQKKQLIKVQVRSRSQRAASRAGQRPTEPVAQSLPKKQVKPKKAKSMPKKQAPKKFLTPAQVKQYKELLQEYYKNSIAQLKDILQKNNQVKTGTKNQLVEKCADGKQFGRIPTCSKCGGGKLRFNREKGTYVCPGYMEDTDFVNCNVKFNFDEVKRLEWQE